MSDKLNALGETIRIIERERLIEAFNAIEAKRTPATEPASTPPQPRREPNPAHFYRQRLRNAQDRLWAAEDLLGRLMKPERRGDVAEVNIPWNHKRDLALELIIRQSKRITETVDRILYLRGRVTTYTRRLEELEGES